jgi:hypothetical protein
MMKQRPTWLRAMVCVALVVAGPSSALGDTGGAGQPSAANPNSLEPIQCEQRSIVDKPVSTLRDIDWCNVDYGGVMGPFRGGSASMREYEELGGPHDTTDETLKAVVYGTLKRRLIAVLVVQRDFYGTDGHHSQTSDGLVFELHRGRPRRLGTLPLGTPVSELSVRGDSIWVTSGPDQARRRFRYVRRNLFRSISVAK